MPKYKVYFRVVHIQGNKVEVKDNNGKLTWYHISDIKKTDMITKSVSYLSMPLVEKVDSVSILKMLRILAGYPMSGHINLIQIMLKTLQVQHGTCPRGDPTKWS